MITKAEYEQALSNAMGQPISLTDANYQKLLKGQKLSEADIAAAKAKAQQPMVAVKGPEAPASASIGKIGPATMGAPVVASGPVMGVDSMSPGAATVPGKWSPGPDWGSAAVPYSGGELGGLGIPASGDKLSAKAPGAKYAGFEGDGKGSGKAYASTGSTFHEGLPADDGKGKLRPALQDPYYAMRVAAAFGGTPANRARWDEEQGRWIGELEDRGLRQDMPSSKDRRKG